MSADPGFVNVADARRRARRRLPRALFEFVDGGAEDEVTQAANQAAFEEVTFRPRMAVPAVEPELSTTVLGSPVSLPVLLSPTGMTRSLHPDAEGGVAAAAGAAGTIYALSTMSGTRLEDVAARAGGELWYQLYMVGRRPGAQALMDRARAVGYRVLVLTVDTPVPGRRERDIRNGVLNPLTMSARNLARFGPQLVLRPRWTLGFARDGMKVHPPDVGGGLEGAALVQAISDSAPTWSDVEWLVSEWGGPVVVKGLLTASDATIAADLGVAGVVVSNHGGRQLESAPASLRALPEVVDAVGDRVEVYLDGGVRRGGDVAKALALGARAVMVGRPHLYGLAVAGQAGVAAVIEVLRSELARTLSLMGCANVADLDRSYVDGWTGQNR